MNNIFFTSDLQYLHNEHNFEVGNSYESNNFNHIYNLFTTKYPDEQQ